MKQIFTILLSVILLASCSSSKEKEVEKVQETTQTTEATTQEQPKKEVDNNTTIELGKPIEFESFTITVQSLSLGKDYEGKDALIINYDWENTGEESTYPFFTFNFKGFQNAVETTDVFMVEGVDLGIGQKETKPGGIITGAQDVIGIDDTTLPLELELEETFSFTSKVYSMIIDLSTLQ